MPKRAKRTSPELFNRRIEEAQGHFEEATFQGDRSRCKPAMRAFAKGLQAGGNLPPAAAARLNAAYDRAQASVADCYLRSGRNEILSSGKEMIPLEEKSRLFSEGWQDGCNTCCGDPCPTPPSKWKRPRLVPGE